MRLLLILITSLIPFISFLQKPGILVLSGDADYYGYDKSEFVVYHNEQAMGRFDKNGYFSISADQKTPLTIKHRDFLTLTVDELTFSKKNSYQSVFEQISPEVKKTYLDRFKTEQLNTCTQSDKKELIIMVDSIASFPGGNEAMIKFITQHVNYPQPALEKGIQGKVYMSFIVEVDGSVTCIEIKKGIDYLLDREAFRCVKSFPKFKPAFNKSVAVPSVFMIPITYKLN